MKFVFWQNTLSIHQSALIRNLSKHHNVCLIVQAGIEETRKKQGWSAPDFGRTDVMIYSQSLNINDYFIDDEAIHVFTGIDAFPMVYKAFKIALSYKAKVIVQVEPYNWVYGNVILRKIKYSLLALRYNNRIDGLLGIGKKAMERYSAAGFSSNKIFQWAYFTEELHIADLKDTEVPDKLPTIIFVGSLNYRKNLLSYLPLITTYQEQISEFAIYGDGTLNTEMRKYESDKIKFYGNLPNQEILSKIQEADFLFLPSLFDGWGAVINEALAVGTRVLCSSNCGASDLIDGDRGMIFSFEKNNFEEKFSLMVQKGRIRDFERENIKNWSLENISGTAAVEYFEKIIDYIYKKDKKRPIAPWSL